MEKTSEELLWAIKNGELLIVKDVVEKQVNSISFTLSQIYSSEKLYTEL